MENFGEIILYRPDDEVRLEVRVKEDTVWLTQEQIAILFGTKRPAITKHLNNIYRCEELELKSTCSILEHMGNDGKQKYTTKYYNLDAILSVGYRVNSRNATLFRRWANGVLKEHLLKGYSLNRRLDEMERRQDRRLQEHEQRLDRIDKKIDFFVRTSLPPIEGVFCEGQIFDAYSFASELIRSARKSILLIDNYIDDSVLLMFTKRGEGVSADIYTRAPNRQLLLDLEKHNKQYPPVRLHACDHIHDRFLILDNAEVYHIGASLKDLGRKLFAFSRLQIEPSVITAILR